MKKLLITGSSGLVGGILWRSLADSYDLFGLDRHAVPGLPNVFQADITSHTSVDTALDRIPGLDYIVHLAGDPRVEADWQSALHNNIDGTANIYAAAHRHGVKRVVFASSNHTTGAYEGFPPSLHLQQKPALITSHDPIRPDGFYGISKAAGEAIARMYFDRYGLESICLRIGSVLNDDDPAQDKRFASTWLSHRDLVLLVQRSLLADVGFGIYYGVSNNQKRFWDISDAEQELGYHPQDDASRYKAIPRI